MDHPASPNPERRTVALAFETHRDISAEAEALGGVPLHRLVQAMLNHWKTLGKSGKADALAAAKPPRAANRVPAAETVRLAA